MRVMAVDGHVWGHARRGDRYVAVVSDLMPVQDGTGPDRLLDLVEDRSTSEFKPRPVRTCAVSTQVDTTGIIGHGLSLTKDFRHARRVTNAAMRPPQKLRDRPARV